jgi:uncharacterized protein YidB (DUF937 family)
MSIFDQVLGAFSASPGGQTPVPVAIVEALANHEGGVGGFLQRFESAGLGQTVQSWVSAGQNLPISPEMIHQVMGSEMMQQLAARTGLPLDQLAEQLAQHLPHVVDGLTPDGQAAPPGNDFLAVGAALLKSRFGIG